MNKAIIGKKLGMTQVFLKDGTMVPVTVVKAGPCTVVQKKRLKETATTAFSSVLKKSPRKSSTSRSSVTSKRRAFNL